MYGFKKFCTIHGVKLGVVFTRWTIVRPTRTDTLDVIFIVRPKAKMVAN